MKRSTKVGGAAVAVVAAGGLLTLASAFPASAAPLPAGCTASGTTVTCLYTYTGGEQTFVAPAGITSYHVNAVGGRGGYYPSQTSTPPLGGSAAGVQADLALTPGTTYYINIGGAGTNAALALNHPGNAGGYNGGGWGSAGPDNGFFDAPGGGGATSFQTASGECNFSGALLVAAGGGGASPANPGTTESRGGTPNGQDGFSAGTSLVPSINSTGGGGATTTAGGSAGQSTGTTAQVQAGTACRGGDGGPRAVSTNRNVGGAGGGGGLFGGGGGGFGSGGGGGSSLAPANSVFTTTSDPASLVISYVDPSLATPLADPVVGLAAVAGIGAAALVVTGRRRRTAVSTES